jgi:hypothetical protein
MQFIEKDEIARNLSEENTQLQEHIKALLERMGQYGENKVSIME